RDQGLGLAAGEETGSMSPRQIGELDRDRADLAHLAAVDTDTPLDDELPHHRRFRGLERFANRRLLGVVDAQGLARIVEELAHGRGARLFLVHAREDLERSIADELTDAALEVGATAGVRIEGPARLPRAPNQVLLRAHEPLALTVTERDSLEHGLFGHFLGARLHHEDGVLGPGRAELQ